MQMATFEIFYLRRMIFFKFTQNVSLNKTSQKCSK